jgi:Uma2 family endonuclease
MEATRQQARTGAAELDPPELNLPEPNWEVAYLFPRRGQWSEAEYLELPTNRLVELSDGCLEVLPMPTEPHQLILEFVYEALKAFVTARSLGKAMFAGIVVRLWPDKMREPDVAFMRREHAHRRHAKFWEGADLVMEVVSETGRERDLEQKPDEYARAGIPEYWIVDPQEERILVMALEGDSYQVHGHFRRGMEAGSRSLPGFSVSVDAVFDSASGG